LTGRCTTQHTKTRIWGCIFKAF